MLKTLLLLLLLTLEAAACGGPLTGCKSNLKNIATSLEMYSADHQGHYPVTLAQLTPVYLKQIPTCPAAQVDSYSAGYLRGQSPDRFLVYCQGPNHEKSGLRPNYPAYTAELGLITESEPLSPSECSARIRAGTHPQTWRGDHGEFWTGCWGQHLDQGIALIEYSTGNGYRQIQIDLPQPAPPPVSSALLGPAILVTLLTLGDRVRSRRPR